MWRTAAVAIVSLAAGAAAAVWVAERWRPAAEPPLPEWTRLPNGLRFRVQRVKGAKDVAVVTVYAVGTDFDPPGQSGLAHFAEHVYVTSAAGAEPARTVEDWLERYRKQCSATTSDIDTCMAAVVGPNGLELELTDTAARMSDLRIDAASLDYERPRVLEQIEEPGETRVPWLPALKLARTRIHPVANAGHAGGTAADVERLTLGDVRAFARRFYCPANARIAVAGDVDPAAVAALIERIFAALPAGEPAPEPPIVEPLVGKVQIDRRDAPGPGYEPCRGVCIAYPYDRGESQFAAAALALAIWQVGGERPTEGFHVLPDPRSIAAVWNCDERPIEEVIAAYDSLVDDFAMHATGPAAADRMREVRRRMREVAARFRKDGLPSPWSGEGPSRSLALAFRLAVPGGGLNDFDSAIAALEPLTNRDMRKFVESWHVAERRVVVDVRGWKPTYQSDASADEKKDAPTRSPLPPLSTISEVRIALIWDETTQSIHRKIGDREYANDDDLQKTVADAHDAWVRKGEPDAPVTIDADPRIPWSEVIAVVNVIKRCGIDKIEFAMGAAPKKALPK
jgi:hypothetical protein